MIGNCDENGIYMKLNDDDGDDDDDDDDDDDEDDEDEDDLSVCSLGSRSAAQLPRSRMRDRRLHRKTT